MRARGERRAYLVGGGREFGRQASDVSLATRITTASSAARASTCRAIGA